LDISGTPYWLNKNQVPVGESALRFNGIDSFASKEDSNNYFIYSAPFSIMGWIYAFDPSGADTPVVVRINGSDIDWGIYLNNNKLRFNIDGNTTDQGVRRVSKGDSSGIFSRRACDRSWYS
jgi:hypothetical protein